MQPEIRNLLASVSKPYRLAGGEKGSLSKDWDGACVRFCLAFPDTYEIGMSHMGLAILYDILNGRDDCLAERVFAPWRDVEDELERRDMRLFSLESQRPLADFDAIGITLPYELTYTNVLAILDLGGIPLRMADRTERHPLVIGGGPSAFNPEPVADFFDAIVLGDGERVIVDIADAVKRYKETGASRDELLTWLSQIRGVYIPTGSAKINKAIVPDLDNAPFPKGPVVAYAAVQDRAGVEIQRGCVRGCRFCQAGMIYRPVRQRSPAAVEHLAHDQLMRGGHENLSLLSLSIGDYACLDSVLQAVGDRWSHTHFNVALPSLRTESLTKDVLQRLGGDRSGSFTLAPEAGTERMRALINKGNTDEDLYAAVERVFREGWSKIKLYFMVGLPTETQEDIEGIVAVANRCLDIGRRYHKRPDVTVSTSTFVPKPHTPLQWAGQISVERTVEIQRYFKKTLRRPGIYYRWHDAEMSFLEGVMCRGGRELSSAIEDAYRRGARFDGWDEGKNMNAWRAAFDEQGIDPQAYLASRGRDDAFPWDHLFADLNRDFLWREYERAQQGAFTPSCMSGPCQGCGVCDFAEVENRTFTDCHSERSRRIPCSRSNKGKGSFTTFRMTDRARDPLPSAQDDKCTTKVRVRFSKVGRSIYMGHLELMDEMRRIFRRAGIALRYTEGYHPRPKLALSRALPVGIESLCEYADVELGGEIGMDELLERLGEAAPEGIRFAEAREIGDDAPSLDRDLVSSKFEITVEGGLSDAAARAIADFAAKPSCIIEIERKGKKREIDLKGAITNLAIAGDNVIELTLSHAGPSVKVAEALREILPDYRTGMITKVEMTLCQTN